VLGLNYWPIAFFVLAHRIVGFFLRDCSSLCSILNASLTLYTSPTLLHTNMSQCIFLFLGVAFNFLVILFPPHLTSIFLTPLPLFHSITLPHGIPFSMTVISVYILHSLSFLSSNFPKIGDCIWYWNVDGKVKHAIVTVVAWGSDVS